MAVLVDDHRRQTWAEKLHVCLLFTSYSMPINFNNDISSASLQETKMRQ